LKNSAGFTGTVITVVRHGDEIERFLMGFEASTTLLKAL